MKHETQKVARHGVEPGLPKANTVPHLNSQRESRNSENFFFGCLVTLDAAAAGALVATGTKTHRGSPSRMVLCCMTVNRTQTVQTKSSNWADIGLFRKDKIVSHDYNPQPCLPPTAAANQEWLHHDRTSNRIGITTSPGFQCVGVGACWILYACVEFGELRQNAKRRIVVGEEQGTNNKTCITVAGYDEMYDPPSP